MVYRNHGYRNGAKNDKISDHCFVTNGVWFQWKNELRPVSKRARRDLTLTKGLSLPGKQWIRVILEKQKNIDFFLKKNIKRYRIGQNWMKWVKIDRDRFFSVSGPRICQYLKKKHGKTMKIIDFWILAGFWGITMDLDNHAPSNWVTWQFLFPQVGEGTECRWDSSGQASIDKRCCGYNTALCRRSLGSLPSYLRIRALVSGSVKEPY